MKRGRATLIAPQWVRLADFKLLVDECDVALNQTDAILDLLIEAGKRREEKRGERR